MILNFDYCGGCHGKCAACLLSEDERNAAEPFMRLHTMQSAINSVASRIGPLDFLAVGIGRGNVLDLDQHYHEDIVLAAEHIESTIKLEEGCLEVATSLIGKIDDQLDRAHRLIERATGRLHTLDLRFSIVVNPKYFSVGSRYRDNVDRFFREFASLRGDLDGSGDIVNINLSESDMPDADALIGALREYRSAINVNWTGLRASSGDSDSTSHQLELVNRWLTRFYEASAQHGLDANLVNWGRLAAKTGDDLQGVCDYLTQNGDATSGVFFVAPDGQVHVGRTSILGDSDPVRNKWFVGQDELDQVVPIMLRTRACIGCEYLGMCVVSGGYQVAIANIKEHGVADVCPSGLSGVFGLAKQEVV